MPLHLDKTGYIPIDERDYGMNKQIEQICGQSPVFSVAGKPIRGSGAGKTVLGYNVIANANGGQWVDFVQGIGDCVAFAEMVAKLLTLAGDILVRSENEQFKFPATEWSYGAARRLVGRGRLGNSDGCVGSWIVEASFQHGTLWREKYGEHDLSTYSGQRAKSWGYKSLPLELEQTADQWQLSERGIQAKSYEDVRDAVANLYGVFICSQVGFGDKRDSEGFLKPKGTWSHGMGVIASDDNSRRPGSCLYNQWPKSWVSGPTRLGQPQPSFWVDAEVIDRMCRAGDTWIIPGINGIQKQPIIWDI